MLLITIGRKFLKNAGFVHEQKVKYEISGRMHTLVSLACLMTEKANKEIKLSDETLCHYNQICP